MKSQPPKKTVIRFEVAPRSIGLFLMMVLGIWLAYQLWLVELILVMALIFAGTFNPIVEWLEARGFRRVVALLLVFVVLTLAGAGLVLLTIPPLVGQLTEMLQHLPETRSNLIAGLNQHSLTVPLAHVVQGTGVEQIVKHIEEYAITYSTQAAVFIGYAVTTLMLSFYLIADATRMKGMVYAIVPRDYHLRLARILQKLEAIVGGYMRGQLITSAFMGVFTWLLLLVCGVQNALSIALFAAVVDVLPFVGGLLAITPAAIAALPQGAGIVTIVVVTLALYMEFESRILVPRVYGSVLRLSPAVVIVALLVGGTLMGIIGALLALPIAAGLLMILEELRIELPGDDSADPTEREREAKAEALYEQLSAGSTASEASEIAKQVAQEVLDAEPAEPVPPGFEKPGAK